MEATMTGNAIQLLRQIPKLSDKIAASAANGTAYDARSKMKIFATAKHAEGIPGIRIRMATAKRPEAQITSGPRWTPLTLRNPLFPAGGRKGLISGNHVFMKGDNVKGTGNRKLSVGMQYGFFARMKSGKLGLFMRDGKARLGISILYGLKTQQQVEELEAIGKKVAGERFAIQFTTRFNRGADKAAKGAR